MNKDIKTINAKISKQKNVLKMLQKKKSNLEAKEFRKEQDKAMKKGALLMVRF